MLTTSLYTVLAVNLRARVLEGGVSIAVGEGRAAWDSAPPRYDRATAALVAEVARRAVSPDEVVFLDAGGRPTRAPTPRLLFSVTFGAGEGTGTLRECGLIDAGGGASTSGALLSYHVHPRIEKGPQSSLRREVSIDFSPQPFAPGSRATRWLGNTRSGEVHDLDARTPNCQIDEIRYDRRFYFASFEEATDLGYDPCAYCIDLDEPSGGAAPPEPVGEL